MDLKWLLRLARPSTLAAVVALILAAAFGNAALRYPRQWYLSWRYPPARDVSARGADIAAELDKEKSEHVTRLYGTVSALIARAGSQGLPVDGLQREADAALRLNTAQYRPQALAALSRVEFEIPREKQALQPANPDDVALDLPADAHPVPSRRRKRRRR